MVSATKVPTPLQAYLDLPPESSLLLMTSVLGATTNWLVLRFLHQVLMKEYDPAEPAPALLLVSFFRDANFWISGAKRIGLDLARLEEAKRFTFVDGLGSLFLSGKKHSTMVSTLHSPELNRVTEDIRTIIQTMKGDRKLILVIDGVDFLLAAGDNITSAALADKIMGLREEVHATALTLSADLPLVSRCQSPLECEHATFLVSIAHQADVLMNLRMLHSGTAKDVSGVIRITIGNTMEEKDYSDLEDAEYLYFVGGDSNVQVFDRGQSL